MKKAVLGADHAGYQLKQKVAEHLRTQGFEIIDVGCDSEASVDYPTIAEALALALQEAQSLQPEAVKGFLCCGSGIGVCITANRFPWVRAVEAHDHNTVMLSRRHNDTNVLCLGGRVIAPELAFDLINTWLSTPFEGGRHQKRVDMMGNIEFEAENHVKEMPAC